MTDASFQKQVLNKLESMEKRIDHIMEFIEDSKLSDDDKQALRETLREEKEGKLLSKKELFG